MKAFLPLEKTLRPANHKIVGTGSKNFASGSLGEIMSAATTIPPLDSWICESYMWEKQRHILDVDSQYV